MNGHMNNSSLRQPLGAQNSWAEAHRGNKENIPPNDCFQEPRRVFGKDVSNLSKRTQKEEFLKRSYSMEMQSNLQYVSKDSSAMNIEKIDEEQYHSSKTNHSAMVQEHPAFDKFDRENAKNPQLVTHVSKHIFNYLREIEVRIQTFRSRSQIYPF